MTDEIDENLQRLAAVLEFVTFRIVQEGLTNAIRHSGSKTATIRICRTQARVEVEVQDFGKGISGERLATIQSQGSGVGIRGMRERIREFEGELEIISTPSGTTVRVTIPIPDHPDLLTI